MTTEPQHHGPSKGQLQAWRVDPPEDPGFRPSVWKRIEELRGDAALRWSGYWRRHAIAWSVACVILVSASALLGHAAGLRHKQAETTAVLQTYLAVIDSAAMTR